MEIPLIPYEVVQSLNHTDAKIIITPKIFENVVLENNRTSLNFDNCQFARLTIINESKIEFENISFNFSFCQIQDLQVELITTEQVSLHFHGCILGGNVRSKAVRNVTLNNCIARDLFLQHQQQIEISFTEENVFLRKWKMLLQGTNINSVSELLRIKQSVHINHSKRTNVRFNYNKSEKVGVYRAKYEQLEDYKIRYFLSDSQRKLLNFNLSINFSKVEDEQLKIENAIINSLSLTGSADGKITVENTKVNNLFIRDFSSRSGFLLYNVGPILKDSKIEVHKSNMDNCWFDNIDFNGYGLLSFYRTRFANAIFTSCNFPKVGLEFEKFKTLENIHYPDKKPNNYYKDQYETFLQLRKSLEVSGNYHEAQKLGAISKESLRKIPDLPNSDKFILWLNRESNNYGLSIKAPLIGILISSVVLYLLYLYAIDRIFIPTEFDWSLVGQYFSFLDLTHNKDFLIPESEFTFWTLLLDFTNKVLVGFFIFQFISAFRKYVKK